MNRQKGLATVEFAVVATAAFIVLLGVIEVSRALFVWNSLTEATRRGARVAAVCPMHHSAVPKVAIFGSFDSGDQSPVISGLTSNNIQVEYLQKDGSASGNYEDTDFVRVSIVDFQQPLFIPGAWADIIAPPFSTTLPAESLGYNPDTESRVCYGSAG